MQVKLIQGAKIYFLSSHLHELNVLDKAVSITPVGSSGVKVIMS